MRDVLRAGTDVDCGGFVQKNAASALAKGLISTAEIDTRLQYLFRMRLRLGHFDPPGPLQQIPVTAICTDETVQLARDGTVQVRQPPRVCSRPACACLPDGLC